MIAYADSSALVKLIFAERETPALEAFMADLDGVISSRLSLLECHRTAYRKGQTPTLSTIDDVFAAIYLFDVTRAVLEAAETVPTADLRSLDAIHLATALSLATSDKVLITYDDRLAAAARANALQVVQPGR
jgi:predicted nucleic acid-binding protein